MINLGFIGCGSVSEMYLDYLVDIKGLRLLACSDLDSCLAQKTAEKYKIAKILSTDELICDDDVDLVVNLTNPVNHFAINSTVLRNGKALFCEKPFAFSRKETDSLIEIAKDKGSLFYAAPDTYLSKSNNAIKCYLDGGECGVPVCVSVISTCNPVEAWHPNPEFFYKVGGGPLWDRGVYFITVLVNFFGRIESVCGYSGNFIGERPYRRPNGAEARIVVETPTHYSILMRFKSGITANMVMSFDAKQSPGESDEMVISCTEAVVRSPSTMSYGGRAMACRGDDGWVDINDLGNGISDKRDIRGAAILEMAECLEAKELRWENILTASHVVDVMEKIEKSCVTGERLFI